MKGIYILTIAVLISSMASAQITYTSASFPEAGDMLITTVVTDTSISVIDGGFFEQSWDFSDLPNGTPDTTYIIDAAEGAVDSLFPEADIMSPINDLGLGNNYTNVTGTKVEHIGGEFNLIGLQMNAPYSDPALVQEAPIFYGSNFQDSFEAIFSDHIDSVPGLRALFDFAVDTTLGKPDSIRFNLNGTTTSNVDAYGTLLAHDGETYEVNRQKQITYTSTSIEIRNEVFGFGIWIDLTSILPLPIAAEDTVFSYSFLADGYKQPIVKFNMNPMDSTIETIEYMGHNVTDVAEIKSEVNISVYPNPATKLVNINSEETISAIAIFDALGKKVRDINNINSNNYTIDTSSLLNGIYIFKISNRDNLFSTKKITVLN